MFDMPKKPAMSQEHKQALAEGRRQGKAVRDYLEALEASAPKRGRKRTPETVQARLDKIDGMLADAPPIERLNLVQERLDLTDELAALNTVADLSELESAFTESAREYGARKGISYAAWRELGVPAAVLKAAGVTRANS